MSMELNRPEIVAQVQAEFDRYELALRSHDVALLNAFFLDHPATIRYGVSEHCYGIEGVREYRMATAPLPPGRKLHRTIITTFGTEAASVATEFTSHDARLFGRQSQTWVFTSAGWKIVAAHVSQVPVSELHCYGTARE
jgi:hypothetical protein